MKFLIFLICCILLVLSVACSDEEKTKEVDEKPETTENPTEDEDHELEEFLDTSRKRRSPDPNPRPKPRGVRKRKLKKR